MAGRGWIGALALAAAVATAARGGDDGIDYEKSPWGVASGAEWSGDHARFNPLIADAGVRWIRYFPEWHSIQPEKGEFDWARADAWVADAKQNGLRLLPCFGYLPTWNSADGGTRRFPMKDAEAYRAYVRACFERYHADLKHWEVWNEFNGSFAPGGTPARYAELVRIAKEEARKVDPALKIGMSCANFDVNFFDAAIKAGAAGHFDFIAVHPYENLVSVMRDGGESGYLSMARTLRAMLAANGQPEDTPLWITETGLQSTIQPDENADRRQAEAVVKVYTLSLAQGFSNIQWFEARGPAYGQGTDHGLIRRDWSPRPALAAYKTMTALLGANPEYLGWLALDTDGYGFVFAPDVLVAWAPPARALPAKMSGAVDRIALDGAVTPLPADTEWTLANTPVFLKGLPAGLVAEARANKDKPFPWGTDYAGANQVAVNLGATNMDLGIRQVNPTTTAVVHDLAESWKRLDFDIGSEGRYVYFRVDPTFVRYGERRYRLSIVVKRLAPDREARTTLLYESATGYKQASADQPAVPAGDGWHTMTWDVDDANFAGQWGWNFRVEATASPNAFFIREARVERRD